MPKTFFIDNIRVGDVLQEMWKVEDEIEPFNGIVTNVNSKGTDNEKGDYITVHIEFDDGTIYSNRNYYEGLFNEKMEMGWKFKTDKKQSFVLSTKKQLISLCYNTMLTQDNMYYIKLMGNSAFYQSNPKFKGLLCYLIKFPQSSSECFIFYIFGYGVYKVKHSEFFTYGKKLQNTFDKKFILEAEKDIIIENYQKSIPQTLNDIVKLFNYTDINKRPMFGSETFDFSDTAAVSKHEIEQLILQCHIHRPEQFLKILNFNTMKEVNNVDDEYHDKMVVALFRLIASRADTIHDFHDMSLQGSIYSELDKTHIQTSTLMRYLYSMFSATLIKKYNNNQLRYHDTILKKVYQADINTLLNSASTGIDFTQYAKQYYCDTNDEPTTFSFKLNSYEHVTTFFLENVYNFLIRTNEFSIGYQFYLQNVLQDHNIQEHQVTRPDISVSVLQQHFGENAYYFVDALSQNLFETCNGLKVNGKKLKTLKCSIVNKWDSASNICLDPININNIMNELRKELDYIMFGKEINKEVFNLFNKEGEDYVVFTQDESKQDESNKDLKIPFSSVETKDNQDKLSTTKTAVTKYSNISNSNFIISNKLNKVFKNSKIFQTDKVNTALDIKRSGDALQRQVNKYYNEVDNPNVNVLLTNDFLNFFQCRLEQIPAIWVSRNIMYKPPYMVRGEKNMKKRVDSFLKLDEFEKSMNNIYVLQPNSKHHIKSAVESNTLTKRFPDEWYILREHLEKNDQPCEICGGRNEENDDDLIVECNKCNLSYHHKCLNKGLTDEQRNNERTHFYCNICEKLSSNNNDDIFKFNFQHHCKICGKLDILQPKLSCAGLCCNRWFHKDCFETFQTMKMTNSTKLRLTNYQYNKRGFIEISDNEILCPVCYFMTIKQTVKTQRKRSKINRINHINFIEQLFKHISALPDYNSLIVDVFNNVEKWKQKDLVWTCDIKLPKNVQTINVNGGMNTNQNGSSQKQSRGGSPVYDGIYDSIYYEKVSRILSFASQVSDLLDIFEMYIENLDTYDTDISELLNIKPTFPLKLTKTQYGKLEGLKNKISEISKGDKRLESYLMRDVFMTAVIETLFYIYFLTIKDITYLEARFSLICEILNKTKLFEVHKKEEEAKRKAAEEAKEAKEAEEAQKKELNLSDILLELQTKIDKKHNLKDIRTVIKFLSNKYNIYSNSLNIKTIELIHDELTFICCHEFRIFSNDPNIHKIIFGDKTFVNQESKYAQFLNEINTVILDKQLQSTEKLPSIHDINDVGIITDPNEINIRNMCKDFRNMIVKQVVHTTSQFLDISAEDHMFKTLYSTFSNTTKYTPSIVDTLNLNTGPEVPVTETNTLPEVLVIEQNAASEKRSKAEESMYLPILNIINNKVHVDYHDLKSLFDYVYISPAFKPYFFYSSKEDLLSTEEIVDYFIDHTYDTLPICVLNMFAETAASTTQDENQNDDEVSNIRTEFKYLTNTSARQPPSLLQKSASTSALANSVVFESPPNSNYGANPVHLRHSNSGVPPPKGGGARFPIKLKYTLLDYHKKYYPIYAATYYGNRKQKV